MNKFVFWIEVFLIFSGIILCMVGLMWTKLDQLLQLLGKKVNPEAGFKVTLVGFVMLATGVGFLYLIKQ